MKSFFFHYAAARAIEIWVVGWPVLPLGAMVMSQPYPQQGAITYLVLALLQ